MTRSAGVVAAATLASRITGLLRDMIIARAFAPGATDAFWVAFMIPNLFRRLVAEGSLTVSFVPILSDWLRRDPVEARRVFRAVWTLAALAGIAIALVGIAFADPLIRFFAPGFSLVPGKHDLAVSLLRWCFPYIALITLVAVAMGALNSVGHFFAPAVAPVLLNLAMISGALAGAAWFDPPIAALGGAVVIAGLLQLGLQLPVLRGHGYSEVPMLAPGHPAVRRLGALMLPAVLGASVFQINVLVSRFLASFLGDGAVSYLFYADRLLEFPLGVFVFALGTASLPSFARLAREEDRAPLSRAFEDTLLLTGALVLPSTIGLALLREPLVSVLFGFRGEAASACGLALLCYALGLVPIAVARIYTGLCLAHENTRTPARAALVSVVCNLLFSLALIGPLPAGALPFGLPRAQHALAFFDLGFAGLALAASLASLANAAWVASAAHRRYGRVLGPGTLARTARLVGASAGLAAALVACGALLPIGERGTLRGGALLLLHVSVGAAVYALALRALRSPEVAALALWRRR
jgi:putative peptidoglycan lipid II flippase